VAKASSMDIAGSRFADCIGTPVPTGDMEVGGVFAEGEGEEPPIRPVLGCGRA